MLTHAEVKAKFTAERQGFTAQIRAFDDAVVVDPAAVEREVLFQQYDAHTIRYAVCEIISQRLESGYHHYHNKTGELLTRLDEVVRAILAGELAV